MHFINRDSIAVDDGVHRMAQQLKILLRRRQVQERVNLSRSEIYRLMALGRFPRSVPLGQRVRAWDADEIEAWVLERIAARDVVAA